MLLKLKLFFWLLAAATSDRLISSSFKTRNECLKDGFVIAALLKNSLFFSLPCIRESTACLKHQHSLEKKKIKIMLYDHKHRR